MSQSLPSWADTPTTRSIIGFVERVSSGSDGPVPVDERVAVFDNDGTLWTEKPMPTQLHYIVQQWAAAAAVDPTLAERQPYRAVVNGDFAWLGAALDKHYNGDDSDLQLVIGAILTATAGESVLDYERSVAEFYRSAKHMTLGTPYRDTVYRPMVELLRYLEEHGFTCYIISGGDRDFMRPITAEYYGIPPERVVGSAVGLSYDAESAEVRYGTTFDFMDDGPMKPVRIWTRIGRRPILAAGNSNGDIDMLRYTQGSPHSLALLIHHDDPTDRGDTAYDSGAEKALAAAAEHDFTVVSVRDDWASVFAASSAADM